MPSMGRRLTVIAALLAVLAALPAAAAQARQRPPHLTKARCLPGSGSNCRHGAAIGAKVQLTGQRLYRGMRVSFRWGRYANATHLERRGRRFVVRVPPGTGSGIVRVRVRGRHYFSNYVRLRVAPQTRRVAPAPAAAVGLPAVFAGYGMWIWQLARSGGGNPAAIAAQAHLAAVQPRARAGAARLRAAGVRLAVRVRARSAR
jgi:hypothetical protein